jgi:UDP-N-acetyl-D-mannosaminuronic acid transferase (WecB/TagA/CpsF family)
MDKQLWTVADSAGVEHGTFERSEAADVVEKVGSENPDLEWVSMRVADLEAPLPRPALTSPELNNGD